MKRLIFNDLNIDITFADSVYLNISDRNPYIDKDLENIYINYKGKKYLLKEVNNNIKKKQNINKCNDIILKDIILREKTKDVLVRGKRVDLLRMEYKLMEYLMKNAGAVKTREEILKNVWEHNDSRSCRNVDVTVRRIREKIEQNKSKPKILLTKISYGYYVVGSPSE